MQLPDGDGTPLRGDVDLFEQMAAQSGCELHVRYDPDSQLRAIIAIHSTVLGPATGGCRCLPYPTTAAALADALRLARAMSYKSALAGLACGGGKAVLLRPDRIRDRERYFESFGRFVEDLGGRYVTAVDSGTSTADMDVVARKTRYVLGTSRRVGGCGDPSPFTARGVRLAIAVAVAHRLGGRQLADISVAIQGVGHVGYALARELHEAGARLTVADRNPRLAERCRDEFGAEIVSADAIVAYACDVFAPCALGGVVNDTTIDRIQARIVAGAANNQLAEPRHGHALHRRGILYLPDYVVNAAGLIHVHEADDTRRGSKLAALIDTLRRLLVDADRSGTPPFVQADLTAERMLRQLPQRPQRLPAFRRPRVTGH